MTAETECKITKSDRKILRELAKRKLEISQDPLNAEHRELWCKHNSLQSERPMVLAELGGCRHEFLPDSELQCEQPWARDIEHDLRIEIIMFEQVADDFVIGPDYAIKWDIAVSNWGVDVPQWQANNDGLRGSYHWDPPIKTLAGDLDKLRPRTYSVDREKTLARQDMLSEIFDGAINVRIRSTCIPESRTAGFIWWSMGMTETVVKHVGIDTFMLMMYDEPEDVHKMMAFFRDDHLAFVQWCEDEGLLSLNNENDYIGSGGHGCTRELPQEDYKPGQPVKLKDIWMLSESQETVGVSPEMFAEFVFPYQLPIIEKAGLSYYGCCEPVHSRWEIIRKIPNLRILSISAWCDQKYMAEALGRDYIFARKPNPTLISTNRWNEDAIRADISETLTITRNCEVQLSMKDVHTLCGHPERLGRWVEIVREEIAKLY